MSDRQSKMQESKELTIKVNQDLANAIAQSKAVSSTYLYLSLTII